MGVGNSNSTKKYLTIWHRSQCAGDKVGARAQLVWKDSRWREGMGDFACARRLVVVSAMCLKPVRPCCIVLRCRASLVSSFVVVPSIGGSVTAVSILCALVIASQLLDQGTSCL